MQKSILFAFVLLTLSLTSAEYIEKNFYKLPVSISNETFYGYLSLKNFDSKSISLSSSYFHHKFVGRGHWSVCYRELDPITFNTVSSVDQAYRGSDSAIFYGGYAIDVNSTSGKLMVDQFNFKLNVSLPSFKISDDPKVAVLSTETQGDLVFVTMKKANSIQIINFKVGETSVRQNISFPIRVSAAGYQPQRIVGGGVLSENQIFMTINDNEKLYEILVDLETTTYTLSEPSNYTSDNRLCSLYVTNKYYGSFCKTLNTGANSFSVTRNGSSKFEQLFALNENETLEGQFTNGDYLVTIIQDRRKEGRPLSYELWDLETMSSVKGRVEFIAGKKDYTLVQYFQSQSGDLYVLSYSQENYTPIHDVRLGVLLSNNASNMKVSFDEDELIQNFLA